MTTIVLFLFLTLCFCPVEVQAQQPGFFDNNYVLSYYGNPNSKKMGILGDYPPEELAEIIKAKAAEYALLNPDKGVIGAFHIVYATVHPEGKVGYVGESTIKKYIEVAKENGMLVFLDHQLGCLPLEKAISDLARFAQFQNVHFALDPEWRTEMPGKKIGSLSGQEINRAQEVMAQFLQKNQINEKKILVLHQFRYDMLTERHLIRTDFPGLQLVHTMDGFGPPFKKLDTYKFNARAKNLPLKGFKLFFNDRGSWSFDQPLMNPAEVLALKPQPVLIIYQ